MVAREKPPNHVGSHAPESDHSELHHRLLCRADCSTSSVPFPKRAKSAARIDGASFTVGLAILPLTCWTLRKCAEWTRPAGRCTRHRIAGPTVPRPAPAKSSPRSEEHTSELQSLRHLVCRLLLEKKKKNSGYQHWTHDVKELVS